MTKEIKYEVKKVIGTLDSDSTMPKELRIISWNGGPEKYDIRGWSIDKDGNEKMTKGICLDEEELADIQEIEVIINCMAEDENVQRIVSALDSLNTKLCCRRQGELFQIALNDILYIESVDRKTFIYTEQQIYETDKRLYELENHLKNRSFFRASKAVIINLKRTKSIRPEIGARLLLTMDNGEKVIVSRQYSSNIKTALRVM